MRYSFHAVFATASMLLQATQYIVEHRPFEHRAKLGSCGGDVGQLQVFVMSAFCE